MPDIRPATARDVDALCDLYRDFHEHHVEGVPGRLASLEDRWQEERAGLAARLLELIESPRSDVLVAERGGELQGFSEVHLREDEPNRARVRRRYCHLQSMFVVRSRRRAGVGRRLLAASESWAKGRGASEMRLDTWEFAEGPQGFYERCGYRTYRRSMSRDLE